MFDVYGKCMCIEYNYVCMLVCVCVCVCVHVCVFHVCVCVCVSGRVFIRWTNQQINIDDYFQTFQETCKMRNHSFVFVFDLLPIITIIVCFS